MWVSKDWKDYRLLDASDGERLELWGKYSLIRPDPQVIWKSERTHAAVRGVRISSPKSGRSDTATFAL